MCIRDSPRVYLLTDLQASDWKELKDGVADNLVPAETEVVVVNIGSNQTIPNRAVIGSKPEKSRVLDGLPIHLRPRVVNHAKLTADTAATAEKVEVVVLLNEKEIARKSLSLKPGETKETERPITTHLPLTRLPNLTLLEVFNIAVKPYLSFLFRARRSWPRA